jgi:predicted amidohydrolase
MSATTVRVAAGQARAVPHDVARNIQLTCDMMRDAAERGVQLLVLPECGLTGYVYSDASEVQSVAIAVDGPETRQVADLAHRLKMHVVIGMLESAPGSPTVVHNTALLIAPGGSMVPYRKTHLPSLGADRFVTAGNNQPVVVETELGRLGLSICYDLRFPEWARALALQGADVILNPTNWPLAAERVAELFTRVRAAENHVYVIAANRGDEENGVPFIGKSQIVDPAGTILASSERGADLLIADIVPTRSRAKDIAIPEDNFAISLFHDRRPNLYGALVRQDG